MGKKSKAVILIFWLFLMVLFGGSIVFGESIGDKDSPRVTATFFDSDLREALKEISLQTKVNIVIDDNVRGVITLELKDTPLEKALQMMLIGGGFGFRKIDDFYFVGLPDPKNPAFAELCESRIVYFQNVNADSAQALLPAVYNPYVKFDIGKNSASIMAPPEVLKKIIEDFNKIDEVKKQIKVKALVTEVRTDILKEWGLDLLTVGDQPANFRKSTALDLTNGAITINGLSEFGAIYGKIKAMMNEQKANIQADPVIVVTEGKPAELFVGDKRTLFLQSQGTNSSTSSTETVEAGTTLKVIPRLIGNQIELTLGQKISNFSDEGRNDQIVVRTNEFNSVVRFMPGQTVMIAGLTAKNTSNSVSKTPILGDIPLIRLFFKQKTDQKSESQLLIFITAEVLN